LEKIDLATLSTYELKILDHSPGDMIAIVGTTDRQVLTERKLSEAFIALYLSAAEKYEVAMREKQKKLEAKRIAKAEAREASIAEIRKKMGWK
jgi:hypothetical protein